MEKNTKLMYILAIFIAWISPLIFFINAKSDGEKEDAKLSLNFEITFTIIAIVVSVIINILAAISMVFGMIGMVVYLVLWLGHAYIDFQAMKATEAGKVPQFPLNFNLIK